MNTENITKALQCAQLLTDDLRAAHRDASNPFAEILLLEALSKSCELLGKIARIESAQRESEGRCE